MIDSVLRKTEYFMHIKAEVVVAFPLTQFWDYIIVLFSNYYFNFPIVQGKIFQYFFFLNPHDIYKILDSNGAFLC